MLLIAPAADTRRALPLVDPTAPFAWLEPRIEYFPVRRAAPRREAGRAATPTGAPRFPFTQEARARLAYHEGGHVVAAVLLGFEVVSSSIQPAGAQLEAGGEAGVTRMQCPTGRPGARARVLLAGIAAEQIAYPGAGARMGESDREQYRRAKSQALELHGRRRASTGPTEADFEEDLVDVRGWLRDHWAAVEAVAEALWQQGELTGAECRRLVARADASVA